MKVGLTLPQFRHEPGPAIAAARRAEEVGLDGVFAFDHLWPLGQPDRPALHGTTLLAALATETERIALGTLVARVDLMPDAVLVHTLASLHRICDGRLVAGLGTGDGAVRAEMASAGLPYRSAGERLRSVVSCSLALRSAGVRTWVGGRSVAVRRAAAAAADGWNGWGQPVAEFMADAAWTRSEAGGAEAFEVSWGGQVLVGATRAEAEAKRSHHGDRPDLVWGTPAELAQHFRALAAAGALWAICAPLDLGSGLGPVDLVAEAAALVR